LLLDADAGQLSQPQERMLEGEGLDFLRESLTWVCQQLMEAEVSELVGATRGERAPEERLTHRNGYRPRPW